MATKNTKKGKKINDTKKTSVKEVANTKKTTTKTKVNKPEKVVETKKQETKKEVKQEVVKPVIKPKKKNINLGWLWVLIGLILPPVGAILYFVWKKSRKEDALKAGKAALVAICIWLFVGMSFILGDKGQSDDENTNTGDISKATETIQNWYNEVTSGEGVVTVIASSTCPHCQNYKPIITEICEKENIKLYFFESDELEENDYNIVTNTIKLENYEGYVPYTFIVKDGKLVTDYTGEQDESSTRDMLKEAGLL